MRLLCLLFLLCSASAHAQAPWIDPADDAQHLGPPQPLTWTLQQKVSGFRNYDKIFPSRDVAPSTAPYPLPYKPVDLSGVRFEANGQQLTLDDYFIQRNIAGLLVIKNGQIVYERYGLGNTAATRWVSYSVAKSVTSMLVGAAIQDGYIDNIDEKVTDYLPRLRGSAYEQTTIRNLIQMASGVAWDETYDDPNSDVFIDDWSTLFVQRYLSAKPRVAPPGQKFNYNTAETNLVGTLLRAAIGNNLATYLSEKIWQPFGMEAVAKWTLTEAGGGEFGGCCLNATLRDYARLGLFAMSDGVLPDGTRALPNGWMDASTAPSPANEQYGYMWWLQEHGGYAASGIFGQRIYVNPEERLVVVQHAALEAAVNAQQRATQPAMETALIGALSTR
ncbi:MAG: serine hydrolase [Acidobacteria bacterium]|nr:serine hydrolase [Acidobacteriota bacterium]MDA1235034.1 serine hydrolase [Acidobacteriota bacterium]